MHAVMPALWGRQRQEDWWRFLAKNLASVLVRPYHKEEVGNDKAGDQMSSPASAVYLQAQILPLTCVHIPYLSTHIHAHTHAHANTQANLWSSAPQNSSLGTTFTRSPPMVSISWQASSFPLLWFRYICILWHICIPWSNSHSGSESLAHLKWTHWKGISMAEHGQQHQETLTWDTRSWNTKPLLSQPKAHV